MIRGIRGATTVETNDAAAIYARTEALLKEMIDKNKVKPEDVAHVIVSVTDDINQAFPARPIRELAGWQYVPVMCTKEMTVPGGLAHCIRVMMTVNTTESQRAIKHIYQHEARQLRPDLLDE